MTIRILDCSDDDMRVSGQKGQYTIDSPKLQEKFNLINQRMSAIPIGSWCKSVLGTELNEGMPSVMARVVITQIYNDFITLPLEKRFTDQATGLECAIVRQPMLHLCGYVKLPQELKNISREEWEDDLSIEVHGGISYCSSYPFSIPDSDNDIWIGFDTAHAYDLMTYPFDTVERICEPIARGDKYRDVDFVKAECTKLAAQLKKLADEKKVEK